MNNLGHKNYLHFGLEIYVVFRETTLVLRCRFEMRCELFEARFEGVKTVKRIDFWEE